MKKKEKTKKKGEKKVAKELLCDYLTKANMRHLDIKPRGELIKFVLSNNAGL